ncbi:hypothetical protein GF312_04960 [Candidatus Poribacteria bacterium]|nr:hypothetical protein [Candidatus Poribacteria bacterium]
MLRDLFYNYIPDLLGSLYFNFNLNLIPSRDHPLDIQDIKKICILATSGIGNLIMLTPMIRSLRRGISDAKISVLVAPNGARYVLEGGELVDQIFVLDDKKVFKKIREEWPDLTIAATHRGYMRAKRAFRTGAMYRIGFDYDYEDKTNTSFFLTHTISLDNSKPEVEQGLNLLRPLGVPPIRKLYMHIGEKDRDFADDLLRASGINNSDLLFGLHIGPGPDDKVRGWRCWPLENFAELSDRLAQDYGVKVLIFGGKSESKTAEIVINKMNNKPLLLAGKTTLNQTAAVMERCNLFISNDSGPMHIAAASGTKVIGIFGPTDSKIHGPYGESCYTVESSIDCRPCHHPHDPPIQCDKRECLESISVDMVMEKVRSVM